MRRLTALVLGTCALLAAAGQAAATHSLGPMPVVPVISPEHVKGLLAAREPITLIDLRSAEEFKVSRLPHARSVPISELRRRSGEIPRGGQVVLYCACASTEGRHAYELLQVRGYRNVVVLVDGFSGWVERGYPVEKE